MNTSTTTTATQTGDLRFEGALGGSEYDLLKLAMPHYDTVQCEIGAVVKSHCSRLDSQQTINVLEIGPGSGITTKVLLDLDPRIKIEAVDSGTKMAKAFEAKIAEWNVDDRVQLVQREILEYLQGVPNEELDVVATGFVIHNIEHSARTQLIREIHRVLVRGGLFVNGDKIVPTDPKIYAYAYTAQVKAFDIFETPDVNAPAVKNEWVEHYMVDAQPHIVYTEQAALRDMRNAGFNEVCRTYRHLLEAVVSGRKS